MGIIIALLVFGIIVSGIGYYSFTDAFKKEYSTTTSHIADTATTLINGDHLDDYLAGREMEEYEQTKGYLDAYCVRMRLSLILRFKMAAIRSSFSASCLLLSFSLLLGLRAERRTS